MTVSVDTVAMRPGQRWHELDALRSFALILGIILHATLAYVEPRLWILKDEAHSSSLAIVFYIIHMLRMTTFFVLAGFFARHLMENRALWGFIKNRLLHVGVPLAVFWPISFVSIIVMMIIGNMPAPGEVVTPPPPPPAMTANNFPLTHLWFLYLLLIFYAVTVVLTLITKFFRLDKVARALLDAVVVRLTRFDLISLALSLPTGLALYFSETWMMWFGIPTPDYGLYPQVTTLCAYFCAYGFGWWLHRHVALLEHLAKRWLMYLLTAMLGTYLCLKIAGFHPDITLSKGADHPLYIIIYLLSTWSWALGLIGLVRQYLSFESKGLRYLADASYWVYIVHLPLVLVFQYLLRDMPWPAEAKLPAVVWATLVCALVTYQLLVRYSFVGTILNGKRTRPIKNTNKKDMI